MITCPWCGTNYATFQSNCDNCGGSLPLPAESIPRPLAEALHVPPPAPRRLPRNYVWRILLTDGWAIVAGVFALVGAIFGLVGGALTISIVAALVGLPFAGLGVLFLAVGMPMLLWRYREAQQTVEVLREGEAALGEIVSVYQNYHVQVNGRYPWSIVYRFEVSGSEYEGKVNTLSQPDLSQRPGKAVYVLYSRGEPGRNTIYPHLYGYYGI
jgi:membrane protein implicated in regulation of membrane protease activity